MLGVLGVQKREDNSWRACHTWRAWYATDREKLLAWLVCKRERKTLDALGVRGVLGMQKREENSWGAWCA